MPVSPKQVAAFVESCNVVDEAIVIIDGILSTPDEKLYRHGDSDTGAEQDYYYKIVLPFKLSLAQTDDLRTAYVAAGWSVLQIIPNEVATYVRLFMNKNSKYFGAE